MDKTYLRKDTPTIATSGLIQVHAHSTGNAKSTAENEASYMKRKNLNSGFFTHVVGNGKIYQTAPTGKGMWDVGGGWNKKGYAGVELIESHKNKTEFERDYKIYVELLRNLAKENNIQMKLDSGVGGILTHDYCTKHQPYNKSDHVDPYPYLAKWGISKAQFKKDIENGFKAKATKGIVRVNYKGAGKVRLMKSNGAFTDKYVANNTAWTIKGIDRVGFLIGKDEYLPFQYAKIVIDFEVGYGVLAYDKELKQIKGTNKKFKTDTEWKTSGGFEKGGVYYLKVSNTEYIKGTYTK